MFLCGLSGKFPRSEREYINGYLTFSTTLAIMGWDWGHFRQLKAGKDGEWKLDVTER